MLETIKEYLASKDWTLTFTLVSLVVGLTFNVVIQWLRKKPKNLPPGPIFSLPFVGYLPFLGNVPYKTLQKMSQKYGNIFGLYLGPKYTVILNEYTLVKETLSHPSALKRSAIFDKTPTIGFAGMNGEEWQEQRRFSMSTVRDLGIGRGPWETIITEEARNFAKRIESFKGAPTDLTYPFAASIISNFTHLLTGRRVEPGRRGVMVDLMHNYADAFMAVTSPSGYATVIPGLRRFLEISGLAGYGKAAKAMDNFHNFVKGEISRHKTSSDFKDLNDFISIYLQKYSEMNSTPNAKHFFSEHNLNGNVTVLYLGSVDTVTSSVTYLFRYMAKYQDIQQRVYREVVDAFGNDGTATYDERHRIPYTFATMMESQRASSIVPLSTTRVATQDIAIKGYTIPKGAEIIANTWALHNDPDYWPEPEKFKPERFLTNDGKSIVKQPSSFHTFSVGRRGCPGETIAWMQILAYFTEVVRRYRITLPPGVMAEFKTVSGLVEHLRPQALCLTERAEQ